MTSNEERQLKALFRATRTSCNQRGHRDRDRENACKKKKRKWWEDGKEEYREGGKRRQRGEIKRKNETESWRVASEKKNERFSRSAWKGGERERERGKVT